MFLSLFPFFSVEWVVGRHAGWGVCTTDVGGNLERIIFHFSQRVLQTWSITTKKKLISIKCICEKEELRDLRKGRVQGGEVWKEERGRRTALRIKHCELSCLHLELLVNNFTSALFLFSKPRDWRFCSNPNKVIYLKVLLSRKSTKWSQIVFSTPTINFCYLYQHGSDVYAFFSVSTM